MAETLGPPHQPSDIEKIEASLRLSKRMNAGEEIFHTPASQILKREPWPDPVDSSGIIFEAGQQKDQPK